MESQDSTHMGAKVVNTLYLSARQDKRLTSVMLEFASRSGKTPPFFSNEDLPDGTSGSKVTTYKTDEKGRALILSLDSTKKIDPEEMQNACKLFKVAVALVPGFLEASNREPNPILETVPSLKPVPSPIPYDGSEPPFQLKGKNFLGDASIRPSDLKNVMTTGETGCGKTFSCIKPLLGAFLDYQLDGKAMSILVIDPKAELKAFVESKLESKPKHTSARLITIGACAPIQNFPDDDGLTLMDRFKKVKTFVRAANDSYETKWQGYSDSLTMKILRADQDFLTSVGFPLLESLLSVVTLTDCMDYGQWRALDEILKFGQQSHINLRLLADAFAILISGCGLKKKPNPFINDFAADTASEQFMYVARGAELISEFAAAAELRPIIDFDTRRYPKTRDKVYLDIREAIGQGKVILYQPGDSEVHDVAGRAIKTQFFTACMDRRDMRRPIGMVADEAQRFMTTSKDSGEANFLDRCRAYRVNTVFATQSIAAIKYAFGAGAVAEQALASILTNTPTKLVFRSTDPETAEKLRNFIAPHPRGGRHILDARPPAGLETGESYFTFGGSWGRTYYQPEQQN